jgi:hypothetical protein
MLNRPDVAAATLAAATLLFLPVGPANAADIAVNDAKIAGGKLVITGTTAAPGAWVRLDRQTDASFNVKSDAEGAFAFRIVYHPGDCIVDLQELISPTALGEATSALVADCGPAGVSPRGAWNAGASYVRNDLVTYQGSTWRARRDNANATPVAGAVWEQFAAAGETAERGTSEGEPAGQRVAPSGPAGGDLAGSYPNPSIGLNKVTTSKLAPNAVTGAKIADGSITGVDIGLNSIGGGRLAPNANNSTRIANGAVYSSDIQHGGVASVDLLDGAVTSADVLDDTQPGGGLSAADLAGDSVGFVEIQTDGVQASEIADNSIDAGEIVDFGLSNEDIGVLFAEVQANGTLDNASGGGVTVIRLATGNYEVDFSRNITACTAVATIGPSGGGSAPGELNVADRGGNGEAVFVDTNTSSGAAADLPFRLVVVC